MGIKLYNLKLEEDLLIKMKQFAKSKGFTVATLVRVAVIEYMNTHE